MASETPPAPRWTSFSSAIAGLAGLAIVIIGALVAIGKWQGGVDDHLASLDKRMEQAEQNQRTYIPVLVGLSRDVSYLADRAHREDEEHARERR